MNFKEIYYFTGKCLVLDSNPDYRETIISKISEESFPVNIFVWLCDKHLILPAIYIKFRNSNILDVLQPELLSHLEYIYELNKKRNIKIIKQVERINSKLLHENISPIYLKGTGNLLDNIYSDPGERMIGDIDMLVKESDYSKTIDIIISLGYKYEKVELISTELPKHFYRLFKPEEPADIEIHRVPVNIEFSKKFKNEMIFAKRIIARGKAFIYVPSIEHRIIHNFIHAQLSNKGHWLKANSLRDLYDLYLLSKNINLIPIVNNVEEQHKLKSYIYFCSRVFNLPHYTSSLSNKRVKLYLLISNIFFKHSKLIRINLLYYNIFYLLPNRIILVLKNKIYRKHIFAKIKEEGLFQLFQKQ